MDPLNCTLAFTKRETKFILYGLRTFEFTHTHTQTANDPKCQMNRIRDVIFCSVVIVSHSLSPSHTLTQTLLLPF